MDAFLGFRLSSRGRRTTGERYEPVNRSDNRDRLERVGTAVARLSVVKLVSCEMQGRNATALETLDDPQHVAELRIDGAAGPFEEQRLAARKQAAGLRHPLQGEFPIGLRRLP